MPKHIARSGQCITSIADQFGFYWKTIWDHPENQSLVELRGDPNMLVPGDEVFVPEQVEKEESCATEARHRFKKKGIPAVVRIQLFDGQEPRAGQDYRVEVDGLVHEGTSDGDGMVEFPVESYAIAATLTIGPDEREYSLRIGELPPIDEVEGVQVRLKNLGFLQNRVSGQWDEPTKSALLAFQTDMELETTGEADDATLAQLEAKHDETAEL